MPWKHDHRIVQRKQFSANAVKKRLPLTSWKIPTANPFTKEHIPAYNDVLLQKVKAQAAGGVAWDMVETHCRSQQFRRPVFVEKEIGGEGLDFELEPHLPKEFSLTDHRSGVCMKSGLTGVPFDYRGAIDNVIDVSMGEQE
jgi:hypothetical protein